MRSNDSGSIARFMSEGKTERMEQNIAGYFSSESGIISYIVLKEKESL